MEANESHNYFVRRPLNFSKTSIISKSPYKPHCLGSSQRRNNSDTPLFCPVRSR
jgi:hypothetical protein